MKRFVCLIMALVLCLTCLSATAEDASQMPQLQKLMLQYIKGSGLRGLITLNVEGDKPWAQLLSALNDTPIQLRFIDGISDGFQYKLYLTGEDGAEKNLSQIYSDGSGTAWIQSDFLLDTLVSFPTELDLLSSLAGLDVDNPTWYFSALRMLLMTEESWTESWEPQLADASMLLDSWMNAYAGSPTILDQGDGKIMQFRCEIPAEDIKQQLKALVPVLLENQELMTLAARQVSREQEDLYLNAGYEWYYNQCIDALPLSGSIVLERQATVLGEPVSMLMTFPVAGFGTLQEVSILQAESTASLTLTWEEKTLSITAVTTAGDDGSEQLSGEISCQPKDGDGFAADYTLVSKKATGMDDNGRDTETYTWDITLTPDAGAENSFSPIQLKAQALLYSKAGDFNPTTLEFSSAATVDECTVSLALKLRTTSLWELPAAPDERVTRSLDSMTPDERTTLLEDWVANALLALAAQKSMSTEAPATESAAPEETPNPMTITVITNAPENPETTQAPETTEEVPAA